MNFARDRRAQLMAAFGQHWGAQPEIWCRAPGRVDLMGSHTDYNLGLVLTLPIDRDTWIAARPRADRMVRLFSLNLDACSTFDLDQLTPAPGRAWCNYARGVASVLQAEGLALRGLDAVIHSTVPVGGGLSSSAALECAVATLFEALGGWRLDPIRKALLCQRAENAFVGVNCGILDQFTACVGQAGCALLLDCRDLSSQPVQLAENLQVVICDTRSQRTLAASAYAQRRAQCEEGARWLGIASLREITPEAFHARAHELPAEVARRCRFIVEETDRAPRLATALAGGDRPAIRELTAASFHGACELFHISVPAMGVMMDAMLGAPGVIGARQAGAGFGGCMVAFIERGQLEPFAGHVAAAYLQGTGSRPGIGAAEAAAGAGVMVNGT
jgi:galactokinase